MILRLNSVCVRCSRSVTVTDCTEVFGKSAKTVIVIAEVTVVTGYVILIHTTSYCCMEYEDQKETLNSEQI